MPALPGRNSRPCSSVKAPGLGGSLVRGGPDRLGYRVLGAQDLPSGETIHRKRRITIVKTDMHPTLNYVTVTCACGNTFDTHSTKDEVRLEICSACHPFFSGKQKLIDTAGRVERFQKRYANTGARK
jgi:large subunit ribosomal protein L31